MKGVKLLFQHQSKNNCWYYNVNQEQEWSNTIVFPSVTDTHQLELVKQQEQQMLFIANVKDTLLFRHHPDDGFLDYLKQFIELPEIKVIQSLEEAVDLLEDNMLIPYIQTNDLTRFTSQNLDLFCSTPELVKELSDKFSTRNLSKENNFNVTKGYFCYSSDQLLEAYKNLQNQGFQQCVLKIPYGSSGKGLKVINNKYELNNILKYILRRSKEFHLLIEGWYNVKQNINCQLWIDNNEPRIVAITEQKVSEKGMYLGTDFLPNYEEEVLDKYIESMLLLAKFLKKRGYYGICGVDSIIDTSGELFPIIELNPRFTQVTYLLPLIEKLSNNVNNIVSSFIRLESTEKLTFEEIYTMVQGILKPDNQNKFIVYTFTSYKVPNQNKFLYRIFAIFYGNDKRKIDIMLKSFQEIEKNNIFIKNI